MKKILFRFGVFIVGLQAFGQSTAVTSSPTSTTASSTTTAAAGNTQLFNNDAAVLVVGSGSQQSLTPAELTQLQAAVLLAADLANQADAAATSLQTVENTIMQNHGCTATAACSMMYQHSQQVTYTPPATTTTTTTTTATPTWTTVATQGQTVTIQAGTTVRLGDPAGMACTACSSGKPLAADAWLPQVTFTATTTLSVELSTALGGTTDPAYGYVKVLQMLGTTGGVTVVP